VPLRRERALPRTDNSVRILIPHVDDIEASRGIDYAQRLGRPPVIIRDAMWPGLFIEYAVVAMALEPDVATA